MAAAFYPSSMAAPLGQVPEETGLITPSHAGAYEFDMAITQPPSVHQPQLLSSPPPARSHTLTSSTTIATTLTTVNTTQSTATPRPLPSPRPQATSHRPRPVSMPPQAFTTTTPTSSSDRERQQTTDSKHRQTRDGSTSKQGRSSNRILGDYTLTKTLGAGSMGKVKLAIHNVTEEKVCDVFISNMIYRLNTLVFVRSSPSKSFPECIRRLPSQTVQMQLQKQSQSRPQKMLRKRYALSVKPPSLCFSITRTSAACVR